MDRPYNSSVSSQKARPSLVIRTRKHVRESGALCQGAALTGSAYCRAHLQLQERSRRMARAHRRAGILKLPILEDMQAVRVAQARVQVALEAGHIDEGLARLMRWGLRMMATTFRHMEQLQERQPSFLTTAPAPGTPRKPNNLYHMPITIINSSASKRNEL